MKLSRAQVIAIAELAKLQLTDDEIERFGEQLSHVLDYAARLEQLDTADIPPTATRIAAAERLSRRRGAPVPASRRGAGQCAGRRRWAVSRRRGVG